MPASHLVAAQVRAGEILVECLAALRAAAMPGTTTWELDALAEAHIRAAGGSPTFLGHEGFPASICASPNDLVAHGIPSHAPLQDGDLLSLDVGVTYDGWICDAAITVEIGTVPAEARRVHEAAMAALVAGTNAAIVGNHIGDIGAAIEAEAQRHGCEVIQELCGHGVGRELHEDPEVPNWGVPRTGPRIEAGMVIAIEPMLCAGRGETILGPDGEAVYSLDGSLAAHVEWTVSCEARGPRILTPWHAA